MGEPSLWNRESPYLLMKHMFRFNPSWESRPSGTFLVAHVISNRYQSFNPSWESRPSGTLPPYKGEIHADSVSTPHGRAVPLELRGGRVKDLPGIKCFNPSWESRPSGTLMAMCQKGRCDVVSTPHGRAVPLEPIMDALLYTVALFQPLMGEPSLWNY